MGDLALAVRSLLKSKLFTTIAVATLAIGIGATTAVYSMFYAVAVRPFPFPEANRLVDIEEWSATELCAGCAVGVSRPMLTDLEREMHSLQSVAAAVELPVNIGGTDAPERVSAASVSGNYFMVLGVNAIHGRALDPNDDRSGAPAVVVLGQRLLERMFGGDSAMIGRTVRINGRPTTVVGIMPTTAVLPEFAQLWMPFAAPTTAGDRGSRELAVIGRLKSGATVEAADREAKRVAADLERSFPATQKGWTARVRPLRSAMAGEEESLYALLLGAGVVLWAIVCANLAGLLLARGVARRKEIAVRIALGSGKWAVIWHLMSESVCIALAGGAFGAIAASWAVDLLVASISTQIPSWLTPRLDAGVLAFCFALSLLSAIAVGLVPAFRVSRLSVQDDLKAGAQAAVGGSGKRLRGSLVVLQLTLALVLLAVSGVLSVTIGRVTARAIGSDDHDVVQGRIEMLGATSTERAVPTVNAFVSRFAALPEARAAAAYGTGFIAGFGGRDTKIRAEGVTDLAEGVSPRFYFAVTPRYFETIHLPVLSGRAFTDADTRAASPVVMINRRLASTLWPGLEGVGRRIKLGGDSLPWRTVVGVVGDLTYSESRRASNFAYVPFAQDPQLPATLLVGAKRDPITLIQPMRAAARDIDPDLPLLDLMTVEQDHARQARPYRAYALTMSAFGTVALILSAIGLYGVVAYGAEQRTREIGLRIALGAKRADVMRLVTRQGMRLVAFGVVFGLAAAALVLPVMRGLL
ncbi:MAG TPA: ADOP family duplicated permease, partial [Gemmatimonadaceae bacterium]